jgi:ATP:ADP antiporter, AAA family
MRRVQRADGRTAPASRLLRRVVDVRAGETAPLLWSFTYFFALLCGYYLLRPIREEMGIRGGVERLHWVFTATFAVMLAAVPLYSLFMARVPRARAVPSVYRFFLLNLLGFAALVRTGVAPERVAQAFFVWISVYNLFVVSVFWSFLADVFTSEQGKRLFGFVAAGGSAGALVGPALAAALVGAIGPAGLVLLSAVLLEASARCARRLAGEAAGSESRDTVARLARPVGGGPFSGFTLVFQSPYLLALALQTLFVTVTSTFVYFQQARIVAAELRDPKVRVALFAAVDLSVNVLALLVQSLGTARLIAAGGLLAALVLHPLLTAGGLVAIAAAPTLAVLTVVQASRRAVHYAIERPAREVLFTVVGGEEKYKAKGFIDTVVYRGGDAASAWVQAGIAGAGAGGTAVAALPLVAAWLAVSAWLARRQARLERTT